MKHCSAHELDLWRMSRGRHETREASSQVVLADWIKVEAQSSVALELVPKLFPLTQPLR